MYVRNFLHLTFFLLSFLIGVSIVRVAVSDEPLTRVQAPLVNDTSSAHSEETPTKHNEITSKICDQKNHDILLPLMVQQWLSGGDIDEVAFCLNPELIDLNEDGIDELAVSYLCSATGNCSLTIYQRTGEAYKEIFSDRQMVSYFDKRGEKHAGFRDLQTRSHGSCCDGDQVVYRFNGRVYQPISCSEYSYWHLTQTGQKEGDPVITKRSCHETLDPR